MEGQFGDTRKLVHFGRKMASYQILLELDLIFVLRFKRVR